MELFKNKFFVISIFILIFILFYFFFLVDASSKVIYGKGENVTFILPGSGMREIKLFYPTYVKTFQISQDKFLLSLDEVGSYKIQIRSSVGVNQYSFLVVDSLKKTSLQNSSNNSAQVFLVEDKLNNFSDLNKNSSDLNKNSSFQPQSLEFPKKKIKTLNYSVMIGESVQVKKHLNFSEKKNIRIHISKFGENISVFSNVTHFDFNVEDTFSDRISNLLGSQDKKSLTIRDAVGNITIQYYTKGPKKVERIIDKNRKEVEVFSEEHYTNVLAFTKVSDEIPLDNKDLYKIYWKQEGKYLPFEVNDSNKDGFIDILFWVIPHLSNQTFEIIKITKAEHLNSSRGFIEDIYNEVKEKDNVFSSIPPGDFVRVSFEKNLTNKNDITIYAKSNVSSKVEVYEKGSSNKIAEILGIKSPGLYKTFLTNLIGIQDTFDLLVVGGQILFDWIVDPSFHILDSDSFEDQDQTSDYGNTWIGTTTGGTLDIDNERASNGSWSVRAGNARYTSQTWSITLNTSGFTNISVEYWRAETGTWESSDYFMFEWYDGSSWVVEEQVYDDWGSTFVFKKFNLSSAADNNQNLILNFTHSNPTNGNFEETWFDGFVVRGYGNLAPDNPTPEINSSDGTGLENQDLNCFDVLSDPEGDNLNVSIRWYKNNILNFTQDFKNNYANSSFFNAVLLSSNTTAGDNWTCSMQFYDGDKYSDWVNSSSLEIISSLPPFNITIVSPLTQTYSTNPFDFNVSLNGTGSWCKYSLDGDYNFSMRKVNSSYFSATNNFIREGSHNLVVYCQDTHSTLNFSSVSFDLDIDSPNFKVQRGNVTMTSNQVNVSVNVSDLTKAFLIISSRTSDTGPDVGQIKGYLANNMTLVLERYNSGANTVVEWEVVESGNFYVLRGEDSYGALTSDFNVALNTSLNLSQSFILFSSKLNSGTSSDNSQGFWTANFTNSTQAFFQRASAVSVSGELAWQIIEWQGANVQSGSLSMPGTFVSTNLNPSVNENKSFLIVSRKLDGDTSMQDSMVGGKLNNTSVSFERQASGGTITLNWFVVNSPKIKTQSKEFVLSGTTSPATDNFYDSVNDSVTFSLASYKNTGTGTQYDRAWVTKKIDSTNIIFQREDTVQTSTITWFVVEYLLNQAPTQSNPVLNSSSGTNTTSENLTVYPVGTFDLDGDSVKNIINWKRDGTSLTVLNTPFEGGSNSSWTKDYSGLGNNGTVNGATWSSNSGYDGFGAYIFDGTSNSITFGTGPSLNGKDNFTLSAWINTNSNTEQTIMQQRDSGYNGEYWLRVTSSGLVNFVVYGNSAYQFNINSVTSVNDGGWHHIVAQRDGDYGRIYIDGVLDASSSGTMRDLDNSIGVAIGYDIRDSNRPFNGIIDDVFIFNRSLSSSQINSLYLNNFSIITSDETLVGESWRACITPNDLQLDGAEKCSNSLEVLGEPIILSTTTNQSSYYVGDIANISIDTSPLQTQTYNYIMEGISSDYWWNSSWTYRDIVSVETGSYNRTDVAITLPLNFTDIFKNDFGENGIYLDNNSIRVIEFINNKTFIETPSQFDEGENFTSLTNEYGNLVWILNGTNLAGTTRKFHIYFDDNSSSKTPPSYSNLLEGDAGTYRNINWTDKQGRFFTVYVEETSISTQADRESIISNISVDGTSFTDTLSTGEKGITFFDMSPSVDFIYNSTPIKGPIHTRIILDIILDAGGSSAGQLFLDFYPTNYFRMTSSGKTFDTTNGIAWVNPSLPNRGAYETSSGIQVVTIDASFTSTGQWIGIDAYGNTTLIVWNKTDSSQGDSGNINFNAGTTNKELPSWRGDASNTEADLFFSVLNTNDFSNSSEFASSVTNSLNVYTAVKNKLVQINESDTSSNGYLNLFLNTTGFNPDNYTVISKATKTDYQTSFDLAYFEIKSPLGAITPTVILNSPSTNFAINNSEITLIYNASDPNNNIANATLILNSQKNETNSTPIANNHLNNFTITLSDGVYNWTVNVTDATNLVGTDENIRNFTIDTHLPAPLLFFPEDNAEIDYSSINFNFSVIDNLDGILICDLIIDSTTYENNFDLINNSYKNFTEILSVGQHFWNISCIDDAGNLNYSETRSFNITDSPPIVYLITGNNSYSTTGNINLTYNASDNNGFLNSTLILNEAPYMNNQTPVLNNQYNNFSLSNLDEGVYTWDVNLTDTGGASVVNGTPLTFIVDKFKPSITLNSPLNETTFSFSSLDFNFTVTDSMDSSLNCNLSIGDFQDSNFLVQNSSLTNRFTQALTDGLKIWNVSCIDDAGNWNVSVNRVVTIEEYPSIFLNTSDNSFYNSTSFNLTYTPRDNTGFSNCSLYLDNIFNQTNQTEINNSFSNNFTIQGIGEGVHNWSVKCFDTYGLENNSEVRNFTVDISKPSIVLSAPLSGQTFFGSDVIFNYTAIDNLDSNISCGIYVNSILEDTHNASNNTLTSRTIHFTTGGTKLWYVECSDDSGNKNVSETWNFTLQFAPIVTLNSPETNFAQNQSTIILYYDVDDDNDDIVNSTLILNSQLNQTNSTPIINQGTNNFTITLSDGVYNWTVNVTDATNLVGTDENIRNFTIDTHEPQVFLYNPPVNSTVSWNNFTFNFSAIDNLADSMSCTLYLNGVQESTFNSSNNSYTLYNVIKPDGFYLWNVSCKDNAENIGWSATFNFTMEAPPNVTLNSPAEGKYFNISDIDFVYTPDDPIDIDLCNLYIDGVLNASESLVTTGTQNTFSVLGILEGHHNWTVSCADSDGNYAEPDARNFTVDKTSPNITLMSPLINASIDFNQANIQFTWNATDSLDLILTCDLYIDGVVKVDDQLVTSGIPNTESLSSSSIGQGYHNWSVTCWDQLLNSNTSETRWFNLTYPDFYIDSSRIYFNTSSPKENESILITANISNLEDADVEDVVVKFYDGNPDLGGTEIGNGDVINISGFSSKNATIVWRADLGSSEIYVIVDPPLSTNGNFIETNESNNNASKNITISAWSVFYGDIKEDSQFILADNSSSSLISWTLASFNSGNVYVTDSEASISWLDLQAIGKTKADTDSSSDFSEIDTGLGMVGYNDSVYNVFTNFGTPKDTSTFTTFGQQINNVPVVNSTNNTNFVTGILWDKSDSSDSEYDSSEKEDLLFVSNVQNHVQGKYGVYDYEIRVPAKLREYNPSDSLISIFYVELK